MKIRRIDYRFHAAVYTSIRRTSWRKIDSLDNLVAIIYNFGKRLECKPYLTCDKFIAIYVHGRHPKLDRYVEYVIRFNPFSSSDREIFREWYHWQTGEWPA